MTPQEAQAKGLAWVPENHPLYGTAGYVGSSSGGGAPTGEVNAQGPGLVPASETTPTAAPAPNPNDPFAAMGGGVQLANGQWVPKNHPLATGGGGTPATTTPATTPGATTPGSATNPNPYSTTPDVQGTVVNTYLDQIKKGTNVDTNAPEFRMQADAYSAAQERARRNAVDDMLESNFASGLRGAGSQNVERRMIDEAAARNTGQFEANLVGRELQSRRDEIANALKNLGGMVSQDQAMMLQRELAALDAALKREGMASTAATSQAQLQLQQMLGTGALNVDLLRALLQNSQFSDTFGLQLGQSEFDNYARLMGL